MSLGLVFIPIVTTIKENTLTAIFRSFTYYILQTTHLYTFQFAINCFFNCFINKKTEKQCITEYIYTYTAKFSQKKYY